MTKTTDNSCNYRSWYDGWQSGALTLYHVPTWGGYVIAIVSKDETYLKLIRNGIEHTRIIYRSYTKKGVSRAVSAWLNELHGFD